MKTKQEKRILVIAETDARCGRQLLRGIASYARPDLPWIIRAVHNSRPPAEAIRTLNPDAVIFHIQGHDTAAARTLTGLDLPCVCVIEKPDFEFTPQIIIDDEQVGSLAADYLLSLGFSTFGFVGYADREYSRLRRHGFEIRLAKAGYSSHTFMLKGFHGLIPRADRPEEDPEFREWLRALPKPAALFVCNDGNAYGALEQCARAGIAVPEDVAILGADNDDLICQIAWPPLSSIRMPFGEIGHRAAALTDRMLRGEQTPAAPDLIAPLEVFARQSTDLRRGTDETVLAALELIRERLDTNLKVQDLLNELQISRTRLEQKFKTALGRTPLMEIQRQRLEKAKHLLAATELPMSDVADCCGFGSAIRFSTVFKQHTGRPPGDYRRSTRARDPS